MRSRLVVALVVTVVVTTSACTGTARAGHALDLGQTHTTICVPGRHGDSRTVGDTVLHNRSGGPVTIVEVSLVGATDLSLTDALLVPLEPSDMLVGIRDDSPPDPAHGSLPTRWSERLAVAGAMVPPGEDWNLVLGITSRGSDTAYAEAARIVYEDPAGRRYEQDTLTSIFVRAQPCSEVLRDASG